MKPGTSYQVEVYFHRAPLAFIRRCDVTDESFSERSEQELAEFVLDRIDP